MSLLEKLGLKAKKFSGTVVNVNFISGEGKNNFYKQCITLHLGYDSLGMPIQESYLAGVYDIDLQNTNGELRTFRILGRPPQIGTEQTYRR